jgi:hypothetical protein
MAKKIYRPMNDSPTDKVLRRQYLAQKGWTANWTPVEIDNFIDQEIADEKEHGHYAGHVISLLRRNVKQAFKENTELAKKIDDFIDQEIKIDLDEKVMAMLRKKNEIEKGNVIQALKAVTEANELIEGLEESVKLLKETCDLYVQQCAAKDQKIAALEKETKDQAAYIKSN